MMTQSAHTVHDDEEEDEETTVDDEMPLFKYARIMASLPRTSKIRINTYYLQIKITYQQSSKNGEIKPFGFRIARKVNNGWFVEFHLCTI